MPTDAFAHTRNALHHAVQVVSALGPTHLGTGDPHENANMGWDPRLRALVGRSVGPQQTVAAALQLQRASWIVVDRGSVVAERPVVGSTLGGARAWLQGVVAGLGVDDRELMPIEYPLPDHPAAHGQPLADLDEEARAQLDDWFGLSHTVLTGLCAQESRARPVRCWPHHFDLGTLIVLDPEGSFDPEHGRSIAIGMAPGDEHIDRPYLYVTPWPQLETPAIPELGRGRWHTDGFFAAVFTPEVPTEAEISAFVGEAVAHCHTLLDDASRSNEQN